MPTTDQERGFVVGSTRFAYDPMMRWHVVEFGLGLDVGDHSLIRACLGNLDVCVLVNVLLGMAGRWRVVTVRSSKTLKTKDDQ